MAIPTGLLGSAARISLGTGATYTLDPTVGVTGAALSAGNFLFAEFSASGSAPRIPTPDAGWTVVVPYAGFGTMAWGLWVRERIAGETTYTGAMTTSGDAGAVRMWWGTGHDVLANWIIGTVFARSTTTAVNATPSITTTAADTLAWVVSVERTAAAEDTAQVSIDNGFVKDYFEDLGGDAATTLTMGGKDMVAPGAVGATSVTYPNTHASNGKSLLLGIPSPPVTPISAWIDDQPFYVAHRGRSAPGLQPEGTLFAYAAAAAWGAKALEVSVWPSSDGVWVCSHDATTGRVFSGADLTISAQTWATLSAKTTITGGYPIARLEQVLDLYADTHIIVIENKPASSYEGFYDALAAYPDGADRFIIKAYMNSNNQSTEARTRGYKTWGYFYDADVDTDLATKVGRWDYMTLNYNATQPRWDALLAFGKPVGAHVCLDAADAEEGLSKGAAGIMAGDFEDIIPAAETPGFIGMGGAQEATRHPWRRSGHHDF